MEIKLDEVQEDDDDLCFDLELEGERRGSVDAAQAEQVYTHTLRKPQCKTEVVLGFVIFCLCGEGATLMPSQAEQAFFTSKVYD